MNNDISPDLEYSEIDSKINTLLKNAKEATKKRLNLEKIPLESFKPSLSAYKKQARSIQLALQQHRDTLVSQEKISLQTSLHIVSNIYGFENWQTLAGTMEDYSKNVSNPAYIKFIEHNYKGFLEKFKEQVDFFNEDFFGNKEQFISELSQLIKKTGKLDRILSDERVIDESTVSLVINFVKYFCYFYIASNSDKFENFVDGLWSSRDIEDVSKFDPISFAFSDFEKLQIIFQRMKVNYPIIYLIHATRIFEKNNRSFQEVSKIIHVLVYCIATFLTNNTTFKRYNESLDGDNESLNIKQIGERYYLVES